MDTPQELQIGDLVRVRRTVELVPLDERAPKEIPAGIYGEVLDMTVGLTGELLCWVEFPEPHELFNSLALEARLLELVFRIDF